MRPLTGLAALAALLLPALAVADAGVLPSAGASSDLPVVQLNSIVVTSQAASPHGEGDLAVTYEQRGGSHYWRPTATSQIHAGFYDPSHSFDLGFDGGFRIGGKVSQLVELGVALDWYYSSTSGTVVLGPGSIPGSRIEVSGSSVNLMPMLFYAQINGNENLPVIPYFGGGIGYEWMWLNGDSYDPYGYPYGYDTSYGGFGWQVWGGGQYPLSGTTRLTGEVFYNGARVGRDIYYPGYMYTVRESVDMSGFGMRFGVNWGF